MIVFLFSRFKLLLSKFNLLGVFALLVIAPLLVGCEKEQEPDFTFTLNCNSNQFDGEMLTIIPEGGEAIIDFISKNTIEEWEYTISAEDDWLVADRVNNSLSLTAEANISDNIREGKITFIFGTESRTVVVTQEVADFSFDLSSDSPLFKEGAPIEIPSEGISEGITLTFYSETNGFDWSYKIERGSSWLRSSRQGESLVVTIPINRTQAIREGVITITFGNKQRTLTFLQEPLDLSFNFSSSSDFWDGSSNSVIFPSEGGSLPLLFIPTTPGYNLNYTHANKSDWCSVDISENKVNLTAPANTTGSNRNGAITFNYSTNTLTISLTQGTKLNRGVFDSLQLYYAPLSHKDIKIYYYLPTTGSLESMPILFAMHGASRNGKYQIDTWKNIASQRKFMLFAPQLSKPINSSDKSHFSSTEYQFGGVSQKTSSFIPVPEEQWTYQILEALFDFVKVATNSRETHYNLWGHSAGGQWTHRFLIYMKNARVRKAVASNAGSYTIPDVNGLVKNGVTYSFPHSLKGTGYKESEMKHYFARNMVVHAGTADTKTADQDSSLPNAAGAQVQGPNRYTRAHFFFDYCQQYATSRGWPFNWTIVDVPGVAHSSRSMAQRPNVGAADLLFPVK